MGQLAAGQQRSCGEGGNLIPRQTDSLQAVGKGLEGAVGDGGDVVVGYVEVAQSGQLAEGSCGDVCEAIPLQVQQLQGGLHA